MVEGKRKEPHGAGMSSFRLVDPDRVFSELGLSRGITFLDLGCGRGEYAIIASEIVGNEGLVYGIDLWEKGIMALKEAASTRGIRNIEAMVADAGKSLPLDDYSVDVCFMATVFHDLVLANTSETALKEVSRVLKEAGVLAILEFKKIDGPPGPPITSRLAPDEVEKRVAPYGFRKDLVTEVGEYNYLITFYGQRNSVWT